MVDRAGPFPDGSMQFLCKNTHEKLKSGTILGPWSAIIANFYRNLCGSKLKMYIHFLGNQPQMVTHNYTKRVIILSRIIKRKQKDTFLIL